MFLSLSLFFFFFFLLELCVCSWCWSHGIYSSWIIYGNSFHLVLFLGQLKIIVFTFFFSTPHQVSFRDFLAKGSFSFMMGILPLGQR